MCGEFGFMVVHNCGHTEDVSATPEEARERNQLTSRLLAHASEYGLSEVISPSTLAQRPLSELRGMVGLIGNDLPGSFSVNADSEDGLDLPGEYLYGPRKEPITGAGARAGVTGAPTDGLDCP